MTYCNKTSAVGLVAFTVLTVHSSLIVLADQTDTGASGGDTAQQTISDTAKKAAILNSQEWRWAVFELGQWLDSQAIYPGAQVAKIKQDFNIRVKQMSSFELRYLLDDLEKKFAVMNTAEAREARAWVGNYLSVLSDAKRADVLREVPDITKMTADQLSTEISKIEARRQLFAEQQQAFDAGRSQIVTSRRQSIAATQNAVAAASRGGGKSYSPYRGGGGGGGGKQPFSNITTGRGVHVMAGPFGAYVSF